jgi:hypothetical protein
VSSRVEELLEAILEELKAQRSPSEDDIAVASPALPKWPTTPRDHIPGGYPGTPLPVPAYSEPRCGRCGISLSGMVGYVCADPKCPSGLGPVMAVAQ